jgi:hypothetical protein
MPFNDEHFNRFISFCRGSDDSSTKLFDNSCMELVIWGGHTDKNNHIVESKYPIVCGGWFNQAKRLKDFAKRLDGVSAYVTFNPVHNDKLSQINNQVKRIGKNEGTSEQDITAIRYIFIDIDVERRGKISSTRSELDGTLELRNRILEKRPEIVHDAIWGVSGNGAYILSRLDSDLPNTPSSKAKIKAVLVSLCEEFGKKGRDTVHIDTGPHFPNAHIGLPGTQKCKGVDTSDRPWRIITVEVDKNH